MAWAIWGVVRMKGERGDAPVPGLSDWKGKPQPHHGGGPKTRRRVRPRPASCHQQARKDRYWIELATSEKTLLDCPPISLIVPTTITRITASMTAYSAMSWPPSSDHMEPSKFFISCLTSYGALVLKMRGKEEGIV